MNQLNAQSIPDAEFQWYPNAACVIDQMSSPIFVKVEIDPMISQMGRYEFERFCEELVGKLFVSEPVSGILKLKILFHRDQFVVAHRIGAKGMHLNDDQLSDIIKSFMQITEFIPGKQRGKFVNSIGIIYLHIKDSALDYTKAVNFKLINDL